MQDGPAAAIALEHRGQAAAADECPIQRAVRTSLERLSDLYAYNHWIYSRIRPYLRGAICEVGGGTGNITQFLLNYPRVVSLEPDGHSLRIARERFADHLNTKFVQTYVEGCPREEVAAGSFDTVICLNVLEHIENDVEALRRMGALCAAGGQVVILVPAMQWAFGRLDESFGHYRRYSRRTLRAAFAAAGLEVVASRYFNFIGAFGWWYTSRVRGAVQLEASSCRTFDRLVPYLDSIERLIPPPIGQSLIMVGRPVAGAV